MGTVSFTQLDVWKKAHSNVLATYALTRGFPEEERYGLTSQMRRAAVSIAANIAEGYGRRKPLDKTRFYNMSQGSLQEFRYYCILAADLHYADANETLMKGLDDIAKMLRRLIDSIERSS